MATRVRSRYARVFTKFDPTKHPAMAPRKEADPTLSSLIANGNGLMINCLLCSRKKELSALEAVASYGGLLTFAEVRAVIQGRCRISRVRRPSGRV